MEMTQYVRKSHTAVPTFPKMIVTQGIINNLPEIIGAIREIYVAHKRDKTYQQVLGGRIEELNINKENFKVLVQALTDLSKRQGADSETKQMYRDMIKTLFDIFAGNMQGAQNISSYLEGL